MMTEALQLHPFELLLRISPIAAIQSLVFAWVNGEHTILLDFINNGQSSHLALQLFLANGMLAFAQNVSSFHTNKYAGALTLIMCTNLKQLCTIMLAVKLFETPITKAQTFGIFSVLVASMFYSWRTVKDARNEDKEKNTIHNLLLEEKGTRGLSD
jgi:hypothetical protein